MEGVNQEENWKVIHRLAGHQSDITELAWSEDGKFLASCALDGHIMIWDVITFSCIKDIHGHDGFVKGLTWDPAGKYLASQADDRTVKVWRVGGDWSMERCLSQPFGDSPTNTFFRRLSWAPDGKQIATANATNGKVPVVAILRREVNWPSDIAFVGHQRPVEVVKFNPRIFLSPEQGTICAVGSQDKSITIWSTHRTKAIAAITDVFEHSVLDLAWSPDGFTLLACSYDGQVISITLESAELGDPLPLNRHSEVLSEYLQGSLPPNAASSGPQPLPESAEQLALEEAFRGQGSKVSNTSKPSTTPLSSTPPLTTNDAAMSAELQQDVSKTKDGKRRIRPVFMEPISRTASSAGSSNAFSESLPPPLSPARSTSDPRHVPMSKPFSTLPPEGLEALVAGHRPSWQETTEVHGEDEGLEAGGKGKRAKSSSSSQSTKSGKNHISSTILRPSFLSPALSPAQPSSSSNSEDQGIPSALAIEAHNDDGSLGPTNQDQPEPSKIICSRNGKVLWVSYLPHPITLLDVNDTMVAATTEDGALHVYSLAGRRSMARASPYLVCITCIGYMYIWDMLRWKGCGQAVSVAPLLYSATLTTASLVPTVRIADVRVRAEDGKVLVTTSDGRVSLYDQQGLGSWVTLVDPWLRECAGPGSMMDELQAPQGGPLRHITQLSDTLSITTFHTTDPICAVERIRQTIERDGNLRSSASLTYLESQMDAALLLNSLEEYAYWLKRYALRLAGDEEVGRVRELLQNLQNMSEAEEADQISGRGHKRIPTKKYLKDIMPILASNRRLQRIIQEYSVNESDDDLTQIGCPGAEKSSRGTMDMED
ncbi:WD40-repeat-containing domain protein [Piptocephalis cylindrospora]|uniref:Protein HIR n=1 Tax=Piptocephalis cylindrospora TaxID=1907219 RepID=A0A4P9Y3Q6_9FUNG|nr:WD40-repeat-containing domain protein [Piptocephalis cylindrospora]|eukprot:RKP13443.1 WD40-repeat-containing domain protein [Piptocephalis cylindrospora]